MRPAHNPVTQALDVSFFVSTHGHRIPVIFFNAQEVLHVQLHGFGSLTDRGLQRYSLRGLYNCYEVVFVSFALLDVVRHNVLNVTPSIISASAILRLAAHVPSSISLHLARAFAAVPDEASETRQCQDSGFQRIR